MTNFNIVQHEDSIQNAFASKWQPETQTRELITKLLDASVSEAEKRLDNVGTEYATEFRQTLMRTTGAEFNELKRKLLEDVLVNAAPQIKIMVQAAGGGVKEDDVLNILKTNLESVYDAAVEKLTAAGKEAQTLSDGVTETVKRGKTEITAITEAASLADKESKRLDAALTRVKRDLGDIDDKIEKALESGADRVMTKALEKVQTQIDSVKTKSIQDLQKKSDKTSKERLETFTAQIENNAKDAIKDVDAALKLATTKGVEKAETDLTVDFEALIKKYTTEFWAGFDKKVTDQTDKLLGERILDMIDAVADSFSVQGLLKDLKKEAEKIKADIMQTGRDAAKIAAS